MRGDIARHDEAEYLCFFPHLQRIVLTTVKSDAVERLGTVTPAQLRQGVSAQRISIYSPEPGTASCRQSTCPH